MVVMDGGRVIAKFLKELGVEYVFGLAGSHINPIYDGCYEEDIAIIGTRHEQAAAFMADIYARLSRSLGVCLVTAGPGFTNALTGVAQAYLARSPVLLISGRSELINLNKGALQELDQENFAKSITAYSEMVIDPNRINDYLIEAVKHALIQQKPVHLSIPIDVLAKRIEGEIKVPKITIANTKLNRDLLERILNILKNAKRPIVIAGSGVWKSFAEEELINFVETTQMPVFTHEDARGVISDEHELCFGDSSSAVNPIASKIIDADVILAIGVNFDFRLGFGAKLRGKVIHVSSLYDNLWRNLMPEIGVVANEKDFIMQLAEIASKKDFVVRENWIEELKNFRDEKAEDADIGGKLHPLIVMKEIAKILDKNTTVIVDGGDASVWCRMTVKAIKPLQLVLWGPFRALGHGIPSAISAKLVRKSDNVFTITGDGSAGFNIMEFETAVRYSIPFICVILNDSAWGMIYHDQKEIHGREVATLLSKARYDEVAEALGGRGEYIQDENDIIPSIKRAINSKQPFCLNIEVERIASPVSKQYIEWRKSLG